MELPNIVGSAYTSSTGSLAGHGNAIGLVQGYPRTSLGDLQYQAQRLPNAAFNQLVKEVKMSRRYVRVIIADPDENVPLDSAVLYAGSELFTDLTDQELYFEIDIKALLKAHNDKRIKIVNKASKDRKEIEYLEPIKVRDLKMAVVTIATF